MRGVNGLRERERERPQTEKDHRETPQRDSQTEGGGRGGKAWQALGSFASQACSHAGPHAGGAATADLAGSDYLKAFDGSLYLLPLLEGAAPMVSPS